MEYDGQTTGDDANEDADGGDGGYVDDATTSGAADEEGGAYGDAGWDGDAGWSDDGGAVNDSSNVEDGSGAGSPDAAASMVGSGATWQFFCPGHYTSYRKALDRTRSSEPDTDGSEQYDHPNEYGQPRRIRFLAEQDLAAHVSSWPEHVSIATVEQA